MPLGEAQPNFVVAANTFRSNWRMRSWNSLLSSLLSLLTACTTHSFMHSCITRFPIRRSPALQQTFYGSPPACPVFGFPAQPQPVAPNRYKRDLQQYTVFSHIIACQVNNNDHHTHSNASLSL